MTNVEVFLYHVLKRISFQISLEENSLRGKGGGHSLRTESARAFNLLCIFLMILHFVLWPVGVPLRTRL